MLMSTSIGQCGPCCSMEPTGTITTGSCCRAASSSCRQHSCQRIFLLLPVNDAEYIMLARHHTAPYWNTRSEEHTV